MATNEIIIRMPKPTPKQKIFVANKKRNNLLILARRFGKTTLAEILVAIDAVKTPNYKVGWASPVWKFMLETFERFIEMLKPLTARVSRDERRIVLKNGSVLEFWSSNDISAGRGRKYHKFVLDESQRQRQLMDFIKGSIMPCLADYRGELWVLGTANGEGTELHDLYLEAVEKKDSWQVAHGTLSDNPYIHPDEITTLREAMGPLTAAQELDSLWVPINGLSPLISLYDWQALFRLPETTRPQKVMALDASISNDTTSLIAPWRDLTTREYFVDYDDIEVFYPTLEDVETGIKQIDFGKLEDNIWRRWQTGQYAALVFDPYQCVSMAQRLKRKGVRTIEFTQNSMRLKADSYLKQVLNDGMFYHPNHSDLNEHIRNATIKHNANAGLRIVKQHKDKKIDLAVALSMAIYAMTSLKPGIVSNNTPVVTSYGRNVNNLSRMADTPFTYLQNMKINPFKR